MRHILILAVASTLIGTAAPAASEGEAEDLAAAVQVSTLREAEEAELRDHLETMTTSAGKDRALIGFAIPAVILLLGGLGYAWIFSSRKQA
ncbi:MAG: hypothetical protein ACI8T1_003789 [Verrucomicrobiales bacterium]|jgi:hypothetical protein